MRVLVTAYTLNHKLCKTFRSENLGSRLRLEADHMQAAKYAYAMYKLPYPYSVGILNSFPKNKV